MTEIFLGNIKGPKGDKGQTPDLNNLRYMSTGVTSQLRLLRYDEDNITLEGEIYLDPLSHDLDDYRLIVYYLDPNSLHMEEIIRIDYLNTTNNIDVSFGIDQYENILDGLNNGYTTFRIIYTDTDNEYERSIDSTLYINENIS